MRASVLVLFVAIVIGSGCGSGDRGGGRRAGSEPIPSSEPAYSAPASSSAPMFPGAARTPDLSRGGNPGGLIGEAIAQEQRRRRAEVEALPQPLRDPEAEGRLIARETMEATPIPEESDEGPCVDAWNLRVARGSSSGAEQRRSFLATCNALPEEEQRCMSPTYQGQHAQECGELAARRGRRALREAGYDPGPLAP